MIESLHDMTATAEKLARDIPMHLHPLFIKEFANFSTRGRKELGEAREALRVVLCERWMREEFPPATQPADLPGFIERKRP
jgi:hypothetical protein